MSNFVHHDETAHYELSHPDLCCLQKPITVTCGSESQRPPVLSSLLYLKAIFSGLIKGK